MVDDDESGQRVLVMVSIETPFLLAAEPRSGLPFGPGVARSYTCQLHETAANSTMSCFPL